MFNICGKSELENSSELVLIDMEKSNTQEKITSYIESNSDSENLTDLIEKFKRDNRVLMQKTQEIREKINSLTTSNTTIAKSSSVLFGPNMKLNFRSPSFLQKEIDLDTSPFDGEYAFLPRDISREIEVPLAESKISKNLYADYIVKLKRLPIKDRKKIEKRMIKDFIYDESNDVQYYINIDWAVDYTNFLEGHDLVPMRSVDNFNLLGEKIEDKDVRNEGSGKKKSWKIRDDLMENEHFVLVNEKTWIFILKLYDGGPSIKLKRTGTLIVTNKNEEVMFSTKLKKSENEANNLEFSTPRPSKWEEGKSEEPAIIEEEIVATKAEQLIRFEKNATPVNNYKKLRILTGTSSNQSGEAGEPQSSTSLDSHSTSFSKEDGGPGHRSPHSIKIIGLTNNSNYCFLNSGLQCLFSLEKLNEYFLAEGYKDRKGKAIKQPKYINVYSDALKLINSANNPEIMNRKNHANFINAANLFKNLLKKVFNPREQQDIHEFIRLFLSELQDELNPPLDKTLQNEREKSKFSRETHWQTHLKLNPSIIDYLFSSQIENCLECLECAREKRIYEIFMDFSVPVVKLDGKKKNNEFPNIYHCLEKFFEEEMINEYKCNFCKKSSRSRKTMKISKLPRVLLVHLKRFKMYPRKQKIADKIEFPIAGLDLKKFCIDPNESTLYNLKCFASHIGTEDYGHYVAFALRESRWYFFNDEDVKPIEEINIPKREAYLLVYEKME